MAEPSIAPCPFCGSSDVEVVRYDSDYVFCDSCGATGPTHGSVEEAITAWSAAPRATPQSEAADDLGHVWDGGALMGDGREVCKRCGYFRSAKRAERSCQPTRISLRDKDATPQPEPECLASALRCDGECGFERTGCGWTCREGEACGRYVHPGDQGFDALERHHRDMTNATPQPEEYEKRIADLESQQAALLEHVDRPCLAGCEECGAIARVEVRITDEGASRLCDDCAGATPPPEAARCLESCPHCGDESAGIHTRAEKHVRWGRGAPRVTFVFELETCLECGCQLPPGTAVLPQPEVPETLWGYAIGDEVECDEGLNGWRPGRVAAITFSRVRGNVHLSLHVVFSDEMKSNYAGRRARSSVDVYDPATLRPAPRAEGAG